MAIHHLQYYQHLISFLTSSNQNATFHLWTEKASVSCQYFCLKINVHNCLIFHNNSELTSSEELLPLALLVGSEAGHGVVAVLPRLARLADVDLVQAPGQDHTAVTPQVPPPLPA